MDPYFKIMLDIFEEPWMQRTPICSIPYNIEKPMILYYYNPLPKIPKSGDLIKGHVQPQFLIPEDVPPCPKNVPCNINYNDIMNELNKNC